MNISDKVKFYGDGCYVIEKITEKAIMIKVTSSRNWNSSQNKTTDVWIPKSILDVARTYVPKPDGTVHVNYLPKDHDKPVYELRDLPYWFKNLKRAQKA